MLWPTLPSLLLVTIACSPAPERGAADVPQTAATDTGRPQTVMTKRGAWPPPGFPIVEGDQQVSDTWRIHLPTQFTRRVEDGQLVFWRPGLTIWLSGWNNERGESQAARLRRIKDIASPRRYAERESTDGGLTRFSYRLRDDSDDGPVESVYGYILGDKDELHLSIYFDDPADEAVARRIVDSVSGPKPPQ